ncbi:MAG: GGDEF domain-containing protein [Cyanothece sp. SIO1E1]|nr:GGDEF domain-containing protein [Cyanothece sp. SIO1E1]
MYTSKMLSTTVAKSTIAGLLAKIAELETKNQWLNQLAFTDPLTGIANRRAFETALNQQWQQNLTAQSPVSLLFLDLDYFKQFNDTHGHQAGDQLLQRVAQTWHQISRRLNTSNVVARYGGEEFMTLLPATAQAEAILIAQALLESTRRKSITVSIGIATLIPAEGSPQDLIEIADKALYQAKKNGRDRLHLGEVNLVTPCGNHH